MSTVLRTTRSAPVSERTARWPLVPASFFGIVLGLAGLGGSWRAAHRLWGLPAGIGETLMLAAALVWAALVVLYVSKWISAREDALHEAEHPVQCCFIGLAGAATSLVALAVLPYSRPGALGLFVIGALFTLGFAVWRTGGLWQGGRDPVATTPVLYLPTVTGTFITAIVASALGFPDWGQLAFGAGLFSWLAIESVLIHRLYTAPTLSEALRPTLGIQLAPAAAGAVACLSVTTGLPQLAVHTLLGYGILQALVLLRLLPWIGRQPFAPSYWAFSFGAAALSTASLLMVERGDTGAVALLAVPIFVAANVVIAVLIVGTVSLAVKGRLLPHPVPAALLNHNQAFV